MAHKLIIMLGRGQPELTEDQKQIKYKDADYILPDGDSSSVRTPFVGDAIVKLLQEEAFDQVFILGTRDSMWSTLFGHCIQDQLTDPEKMMRFQALEAARKAALAPTDEQMGWVDEAYAAHLGLPVHCCLTPVGKNQDELWAFFRELAFIPARGDKVSIDITHGLRFQPFMLVLAMAYFRTVRENISWGKVYYGAFELKDLYFEGKTPLFELSPMLSTLEWSQAANAFRNYGDILPIHRLLGQLPPIPEIALFRKSAEDLAQSLQFYQGESIGTAAEKFCRRIQGLLRLPLPELTPFRLVSDSLLELPQKLAAAHSEWERLLILADRHLNNEGQFGLAIMATMEAVSCRFAAIYQVEKNLYNHKNLLRLSRNRRHWPKDQLPVFLADFPKWIGKATHYRNAIAHFTGEIRDVGAVIQDFPRLFEKIRMALHEPEMEQLPHYMPFSTPANRKSP